MRVNTIRRSVVAVVAVTMALTMSAVPASARGGGGGSSGGGHSSPASHSSSSGGRTTHAPTNSRNSSNSSRGRSTQSPSRTGTNTPRPHAASGPIIHSSSPSRGSVTVSRSARATGSNYSVGGHTYTYRTVTYYRGFHGGYPLYGTGAYWLLLNDPYYYQNYSLIGSPWYGHQYPVGYGVQNGQLVASHQSSGLAWLWTLVIIILVAVAAVWAFVFIRGRRAGGTFADRL